MNLCRSMTGAMRKYWTGIKLAGLYIYKTQYDFIFCYFMFKITS